MGDEEIAYIHSVCCEQPGCSVYWTSRYGGPWTPSQRDALLARHNELRHGIKAVAS